MASEITVAVNGALGKMGSTVLTAAALEPGVIPIGGADIAASSSSIVVSGTTISVPLAPSLSDLFKISKPDVVVDFTNGEAAKSAIITCIDAGVRVVSGSTGLAPDDFEEIAKLSELRQVGVISASNFALGAVVLIHLAGIASKYFDYADLPYEPFTSRYGYDTNEMTRYELLKNQGPNLIGVGSKTDAEWLYNWIKNPSDYHHTTRMPDLRLTHEEAADITSYLLTLENSDFDDILVDYSHG